MSNSAALDLVHSALVDSVGADRMLGRKWRQHTLNKFLDSYHLLALFSDRLLVLLMKAEVPEQAGRSVVAEIHDLFAGITGSHVIKLIEPLLRSVERVGGGDGDLSAPGGLVASDDDASGLDGPHASLGSSESSFDETVIRIVRSGAGGYRREAGLPEVKTTPSVAQTAANASITRVFYATDRMPIAPSADGAPTSVVGFGPLRSESGKLNYGQCLVSIPKVHKVGKLESPSILKLEFRPDPAKHIVLAEVHSLEEEDFLNQVGASIANSETKEAFVFIHGYNVSFEDAARRTGQIAFDLNFVGAPIFYSWPSNATLEAYIKDENNVAWSAPHLQRFLGLLGIHSGAKRIHIIAHSMGNRAVCEALKNLSYDPTTQLKFNQLILAAPDIDADTFRELSSTIQRLSGRITLYESSKDKALLASKKIHGYARAGEPILTIPGFDAIDASAIDTDFLGHSYFSDTWPLLSDIHAILFKDEPPESRFGLVEVARTEGKYYMFKA